MTIWDNLLDRVGYQKKPVRKEEPKKEKSFQYGDDWSYQGYVSIPNKSIKDYIEAYKREWVHTCISCIAEDVADIKLRLYKLKNNQREEIQSHELLDLIYKVNFFQSKNELFYLTQVYLSTCGMSYWYLGRRNENNPKAKPEIIFLLRPDLMKIKPGNLAENKFIDKYEYDVFSSDTSKKNIKKEFNPWEILYFKRPDPLNEYSGFGTTQALAASIDIDNFATEYNRKFFFNSARPDAILTTDGNLDEDIRRRLEKRLKGGHQGINKSNDVMILEGGMEYKPFSQTAKDMQMENLLRWTRDKILAGYKIPKTAVGIVEDVNRANAEASEYVYMKNCIKPKMQMIVDFLNENLVPLYGDDLFLDFDDPVPENQELKFQKWEKGLNKIYTLNELRREEGLTDVENGDQIYFPINVIPIGEAEKAEKEVPISNPNAVIKVTQVAGRKKRLKKLKEEAKKAGEKLDLKKDFSETVRMLAKDLVGRKRNGEEKPEVDKLEANWKALIRYTNAYENRFKQLLRNIYGRQEREVLNNLQSRKALNLNEKAIGDWLFDENKYVEISILQLGPLIKNIVGEKGSETSLGLSAVEFNMSPKIIKYLESNTRRFSKSMTATQIARLRKSLADGVKEGESVPQLSKRVKRLFKGFSRFSATRIARSEVMRAANYGIVEGYKQSGVVKGKKWVTAFDERTCPFCERMNGKVISLSKNYFDKGDSMKAGDANLDLSYENIGHPPLHTNCRCTTTSVLKELKDSNIPKIKKLEPKLNKNKELSKRLKRIDDVIKEAKGREKKNPERSGKGRVDSDRGNKGQDVGSGKSINRSESKKGITKNR